MFRDFFSHFLRDGWTGRERGQRACCAFHGVKNGSSLFGLDLGFWCRYNFVLFPRDLLKMGMPTYSFSVQTSHLTSMAEEGFDFNACIYNVAMLVSPHLSFLVQKRGLDSADLISFLLELNFHVNGEAYNINTLNERQKNMVKDLADLGLIELQQEKISDELDKRVKKFLRGAKSNLEGLKDKRLKGQLAVTEELYGKSAQAAAKAEKLICFP